MVDDYEPSFEEPKTKNSFDLFVELNCVHGPRPERDSDDDDVDSGWDGSRDYADRDPEIEDEVDRMDEDKMMLHILDCVAALAEKQHARVALKKPLNLVPEGGEALTAAQQASRNKVFKAALGLLAEGLTHDGVEGGGGAAAAARELAWAFPDSNKRTDGRGWLPLHWAVAAAASAAVAEGGQYGVTEADVKAVYALDPLGLCRHHLEKDAGDRFGAGPFGFTPSHLLCMGPTTEQTKALVRYFSVASPPSFTMNARCRADRYVDPEQTFSALYVACRFGQPTEWLLQHLLQLDSSACRHQSDSFGRLSALRTLCKYTRGHLDVVLLRCLLAADGSTEVVYDGVRGCLESKVLTNRVETVTLLLEANPQAAHHAPRGLTLAHVACCSSRRMSAQECIDILKLLLAEHKDAFSVACQSGSRLPVHYLAQYGSVEALEYLLDACPEVPATTLTVVTKENLLHCVAQASRDDQGAKARLLCSRYPAMMLQRDYEGQMPLHAAISSYSVAADTTAADVMLALCEAGGREVASASAPVVHGSLPLHQMTTYGQRLKLATPLSSDADAFRLLLRLYPEAAGNESEPQT